MGNVLSKPIYSFSFIDKDHPNKRQKISHMLNDKVRSFRMQEEFGPKKFIKP